MTVRLKHGLQAHNKPLCYILLCIFLVPSKLEKTYEFPDILQVAIVLMIVIILIKWYLLHSSEVIYPNYNSLLFQLIFFPFTVFLEFFTPTLGVFPIIFMNYYHHSVYFSWTYAIPRYCFILPMFFSNCWDIYKYPEMFATWLFLPGLVSFFFIHVHMSNKNFFLKYSACQRWQSITVST